MAGQVSKDAHAHAPRGMELMARMHPCFGVQAAACSRRHACTLAGVFTLGSVLCSARVKRASSHRAIGAARPRGMKARSTSQPQPTGMAHPRPCPCRWPPPPKLFPAHTCARALPGMLRRGLTTWRASRRTSAASGAGAKATGRRTAPSTRAPHLRPCRCLRAAWFGTLGTAAACCLHIPLPQHCA